jgi:hypothetical protein
MKKLYLITSLILLLSNYNSYGQGENNFWYFGSGVGFNFQNGSSTTSPTLLNNANSNFQTNNSYSIFSQNAAASRSIASASKNDGTLLFYSDGVQIFNKLHQVMSGSIYNYTYSQSISKQCVVVPNPSNSNQYFLFSSASPRTFVGPNEHSYFVTLIDFTTNVNGTVVYNSPFTNFLQSSQSITATVNQNQDGYLLLIPHGADGYFSTTNELVVYEVNSSGTTNLLISNLLNFYIGFYSEIKISNSFINPKICISNAVQKDNFPSNIPKTRVYDFNRQNGTVSSNFILEHQGIVTSCEFSSENNLLYAILDTGVIFPSNSTDNFRLVVFDLNNPSLPYRIVSTSKVYSTLQRAIDGNIYFSGNQENSSNQKNKIFKIENQNSYLNSSVSTQEFVFGTQEYTLGLPQLIPSFFGLNNSCQSLTKNTEPNTGVFTYQDYSDITTELNYNINFSTQDITMKANDFILLKPNTHIVTGSKFLAKIENCFINNNKKEYGKQTENFEKSEENINKTKINIYPNPSNSYVTFESDDYTITNITINSTEGFQVFDSRIDNTNSYQLDVSFLRKGIYIVTFKTKEGNTFVDKLIKN